MVILGTNIRADALGRHGLVQASQRLSVCHVSCTAVTAPLPRMLETAFRLSREFSEYSSIIVRRGLGGVIALPGLILTLPRLPTIGRDLLTTDFSSVFIGF